MLYDRVYFATATTGTGTITAGAAETGFRTMAGASIPDGTELEYCITDGTAWETGTGIVGGTSTTLTRVLSASSTGSLISLSGSAKAFVTPIAAKFNLVSRGVHAIQPLLAAGAFVSCQVNALALTVIAAAANRLDYIPFIPARDIAVDRMDVEVSTLAAASTARLGIYADSAGSPGAKLVEGTATIDCSTAGLKSATLASTLRMSRNVTYWLAILNSAAPSYRAIALGGVMPMLTNATLNTTYVHKRQTQTYASGLPATASGLTDIATTPVLIKLRTA